MKDHTNFLCVEEISGCMYDGCGEIFNYSLNSCRIWFGLRTLFGMPEQYHDCITRILCGIVTMEDINTMCRTRQFWHSNAIPPARLLLHLTTMDDEIHQMIVIGYLDARDVLVCETNGLPVSQMIEKYLGKEILDITCSQMPSQLYLSWLEDDIVDLMKNLKITG